MQLRNPAEPPPIFTDLRPTKTSDQGPLELPESLLCRGLVDSHCLSLEWSHSSLLRLTLVLCSS